MTFFNILWCLLVHWRKHRRYGRSRKCYECGLYFRDGNQKHWRNK